MNTKVLLASIVSLALAFPVASNAQAAAESALTNALSSSATAKAGSTLGRALNQSSDKVGARIQDRASTPSAGRVQAVHPQRKNQVAANQGSRLAAPPSHAAGISIQGGEITCAPASSQGQVSTATTAASTSADCAARKTASASKSADDKYKSFVTLPPPK